MLLRVLVLSNTDIEYPKNNLNSAELISRLKIKLNHFYPKQGLGTSSNLL